MAWKAVFMVLCCQMVLWSPAFSDYNDDLDDIRAHQGDVDKMIEYVMTGPGHHQAYHRAATVSDMFGARFTGDEALEQAMGKMYPANKSSGWKWKTHDTHAYTSWLKVNWEFPLDLAVKYYIKGEMEDEGFHVHLESVEVPHWIRGEERARMLEPREVDMAVMALGNSVATPPGGIKAPVLVVKTFEELENSADAEGKIIVYNQEWTDYGSSVPYRSQGATRAARAGGVASLVKSVTQFSLYTLHTGMQNYGADVDPIPAAALTVEDVELLQRLQDSGYDITLELFLNITILNNTFSNNLVAEIKGSAYPNETVIFGGHIDSWDAGTGVMDDLGGCVISWQALTMVKELGFQPKRTMRVVLWTAEEVGLIGGREYYERNKGEVNQTSLIMEADSGTFTAYGIQFTGSGLARAYMEEVVGLTSSINTSYLGQGGAGPDIGWWIADGVPGGSLANRNEDYFFYHHTHADTLTMQDPDDLDLCVLVWAATAYVVADIDSMLPREGDYPDIDTDLGNQLIPGYLVLVLTSILSLFSIRFS